MIVVICWIVALIVMVIFRTVVDHCYVSAPFIKPCKRNVVLN
jgi:hypothetical protein